MKYEPKTTADHRMECRAKWAAPHIYGEHAAIHQLLHDLAHAEAVLKWQEGEIEMLKNLERDRWLKARECFGAKALQPVKGKGVKR